MDNPGLIQNLEPVEPFSALTKERLSLLDCVVVRGHVSQNFDGMNMPLFQKIAPHLPELPHGRERARPLYGGQRCLSRWRALHPIPAMNIC